MIVRLLLNAKQAARKDSGRFKAADGQQAATRTREMS